MGADCRGRARAGAPSRSRRRRRTLVGTGRRGGVVRGHAPALRPFHARHARDAVCRSRRMDSALQRQLPVGRRRHFAASGAAEQLHHGAGRLGGLGGDRKEGGAVHGVVPDHVGPHQRRVHRARWRAVLRLLRVDADPAVPDHRDLGWPEPRVCRDQVLPVHASRFAADARRADLPVLDQRRELLDPRVVSAAAVVEHPGPAVHRLLRGFRGQGADVARAHMASRRARRSPHRWLGRAGGDHAEGRRLRLHPFCTADPARCQPLPRRLRHYAVVDRGNLHRLCRAGPAGHEEADRVLVDRAHGLCHARPIPVQRTRDRGQHRADDLARLHIGGDVPVRRRALRPHAQPTDRRLWRRREHDAEIRGADDGVRHGQCRVTGHQRFRR